MKLTQKAIIIRHLESVGDWQPAYKLRGLNTALGFLGHQADRRCRELAEEGKIDHKIDGKFSFYKAKEPQYRTITAIHPITGERENIQLRIN